MGNPHVSALNNKEFHLYVEGCRFHPAHSENAVKYLAALIACFAFCGGCHNEVEPWRLMQDYHWTTEKTEHVALNISVNDDFASMWRITGVRVNRNERDGKLLDWEDILYQRSPTPVEAMRFELESSPEFEYVFFVSLQSLGDMNDPDVIESQAKMMGSGSIFVVSRTE